MCYRFLNFFIFLLVYFFKMTSFILICRNSRNLFWLALLPSYFFLAFQATHPFFITWKPVLMQIFKTSNSNHPWKTCLHFLSLASETNEIYCIYEYFFSCQRNCLLYYISPILHSQASRNAICRVCKIQRMQNSELLQYSNI